MICTLGAVVLDTSVYAMLIPLLPDYRFSLDLSQTAAGLVLSAYAAGLILAIPPLALFADRLNRERVLLLGIAGLLLAGIAYPLADSTAALAAARLIQGGASAAVWTAGLALIAERCTPRRRGVVFGWVMTGFSVGMMLGPPIGGFGGDLLGPEAIYTIMAAMAATLMLASVWLLGASATGLSATRHPPPVRRLLLDRTTLGLCAVVASIGLIMGLLEPTLPPWLADVHDHSASAIGLLFGLLALAFGVGSLVGGALTDRAGPGVVLGVGGVALLLILPLFPLIPTTDLLPLQFTACGMLSGIALAPTLPGLAARVDQLDGRSYAFVYALFNLAMATGLAVGPALGAVLAEHYGLQTTLLSVSLTLALCLPGVRLLSRGIRSTPSSTHEPRQRG